MKITADQESTETKPEEPSIKNEPKFSYRAAFRGILYTGLLEVCMVCSGLILGRFNINISFLRSFLETYIMAHLQNPILGLFSLVVTSLFAGCMIGRLWRNPDLPFIWGKTIVVCSLSALTIPIPSAIGLGYFLMSLS